MTPTTCMKPWALPPTRLPTNAGTYWLQSTSRLKNLSRPATIGATVKPNFRIWNAWREGLEARSVLARLAAFAAPRFWNVAMGGLPGRGMSAPTRGLREGAEPASGRPGPILKLVHLMFRLADRFAVSCHGSACLL